MEPPSQRPETPPPPPTGPREGWYEDPAGESGLRWWDGRAWTPHTAPRPQPSAAPGPVRRRRPWLVVTVVVVVLAGLSGGLVIARVTRSPAWPSGIGPIAAFVSHDRGLSFLHTVPIHFESPKVFDRGVEAQDRASTASERADVRRQASAYRALGLIGGAVDLQHAETALDAGDVLAYYDDSKKDITVRGTDLTPAVKITIAHEMTHALQDQHFDLTKLDDRADTGDKSFAMTAVEEGDAVLTQNDYAGSLSPSEQRKANAEEGSGSGPSSGSGTSSSGYLEIDSAVPYVLGPDFVLVLYDTGGIPAINHAFVDPPTSELDIVNPTAYLLGRGTKDVRAPALSAGERRDGPADSFGAFDTYMTLAGQMDDTVALEAADAWDGGSMDQYTEVGRSCTKVDVTGGTAAQSNVLYAAFTAWAGALAQHQATVVRQGQTTAVTACDPGKAATAGTHSRSKALDLVDERNSNIAGAYLYASLSPQVALCVGDMAIGDPALLHAESTADGSYASPPAAAQQEIDSQTRKLIATCRARGNQPSP